MKVSLAPVALVAVLATACAAGGAEGPVTRVVNLLTELKGRVEADGTAEQATYDKYACWCEETTSQKAQSITATRAQLQGGGSQILELRGTIATTASEIKQLGADIKQNEEAQQKATSIRQKENAAYLAEKVELEQAIAALEAATTVLRDATSGMSLRQKAVDSESKAKVISALASLHAFVEKLPEKHRPGAKELSALRKASRYAPQSMTVQGILQDMYSTFTQNLETLASDEAVAHRNFETIMAEYQTELETLQESLQKKEALKVESERMLADASQEYSDAEATLKADVEFFDTTKASCESKTSEWATRKQLRSEELAGIDKALEILTSDEAKTLFSKAIKPGYDQSGSTALLQLSATPRGAPVDKAGKALQVVARASRDARVASLAATVRAQAKAGGHFDEVITSIDALIGILVEEGKEDQRRATHCQQQYQNITLAQEDISWKIEKNEAKITKLNQLKEARGLEVNETVTELENVRGDMKDMEDERAASNGEFKQAKKDDEDAIALLQQAKEALAAYYVKEGMNVDSLLKVSAAKGKRQAPEPEFKLTGKDKRKGEAKGIVAILQQIIEDLQHEVDFGEKAEEKAQLDYEDRLAAAKALERDLEVKKTNLDSVIAQADLDLEKEDGLKKENTNDLSAQNQTLEDLKPACDWMLGSLAERREKRELELDGLRQAKEFLAGYRPNPELVQLRK